MPCTLAIGRLSNDRNAVYSETTSEPGAPKKDGCVSRATQTAFQKAAWRYREVLSALMHGHGASSQDAWGLL